MILTVRKKPVVVQALQWTGDNWDELVEWCPYGLSLMSSREGLKIETLEGKLHVTKGDYIIKGVEGEYYPCKPDIFKATYEALNTEKAGHPKGEDCPYDKDIICKRTLTCEGCEYFEPKSGRLEEVIFNKLNLHEEERSVRLQPIQYDNKCIKDLTQAIRSHIREKVEKMIKDNPNGLVKLSEILKEIT